MEPETAMRNYLHHRKVLMVFLALNLAFEILLYSYLFFNMEYIITQLAQIYKELTVEKLHRVFLICNGIDIFINFFMYSFAFYSVLTHKASKFSIFNSLLIIAIFSRIITSYLNVLNLLMFILKIVLYLYSRFVLSLLFSVLLVPEIPID